MPDPAIAASQAAYQLAATVDQAISAAVPTVVDLQVAATVRGAVIVSGCVPTSAAQRRVEEVARSIPGVHQFVDNLTVA